jgi:hypothetical protein
LVGGGGAAGFRLSFTAGFGAGLAAAFFGAGLAAAFFGAGLAAAFFGAAFLTGRWALAAGLTAGLRAGRLAADLPLDFEVLAIGFRLLAPARAGTSPGA